MARKKPDYSSHNLPLIIKYCEENNLKWYWKNEEQGHLVITNLYSDAYIWVQRMVVGVRMRNGVELAKTFYDRPSNYRFDKKRLDDQLLTKLNNSQKPLTHTDKYGIKITRTPAHV